MSQPKESVSYSTFNRLLDFFLTLIVWMVFIDVAVHEMGHSLVAELLGFKSLVVFSLGSGFVLVTDPVVGPYYWIIYPSGGLFAATIAGLLWWRAWATPSHWDMDDESVLAMVALIEVGIGASELVAYLMWPRISFTLAEVAGALVGLTIALRLYWRKLLIWLS